MENAEGKLFHSGPIIFHILKDENSTIEFDMYKVDLSNLTFLKMHNKLQHANWEKVYHPVEIDEDVAQGFIVGIFEEVG